MGFVANSIRFLAVESFWKSVKIVTESSKVETFLRHSVVNYEIWGVLQRRVYRTRIRDVDHLKQRLVKEWRHFSQDIIDRAVRQLRVRLRACVRENGAILIANCNWVFLTVGFVF